MSTLKEEKVFRDPITGYVKVDQQLIWDCIQSREVQRMKRIRQLGSTSVVYHTGEHSRFAHSLGVYEIVRRMVSEVPDLRDALTDYEKITVELAALLHDIGHAPFSHSFESVMNTSHEDYTVQIIREESEVHNLLVAYNPNLPNDVAMVIEKTHPNKILCQLVSSQLDADRMDYLLRDSYFTGTKYGEFDLERILRTLRVADDKVVVKASGMHTIEDYIMARYHMYWQVYYHPVSRSMDTLLNCLFRRLKDLYQSDNSYADKYPMFKALLTKDRLSNDEYFLLDDSVCWYSFQLMMNDEDKILADLANRLINRNLFKYDSIDKEQQIKEKVIEKGFDERYYLFHDHQKQSPYKPYADDSASSIWVMDEFGKINELSHVSYIVSAVCANNQYQDEKIFFPKEIL